MNFLNSAILLGLLAALLPLLIHLFTRSKAKPVVFSSLRFLKALQNQKIRRVRLRQILLLILRTLIVIFLVLGFARPTCRSTSPAQGANAKTSTAIVIDHSVSMTCQHRGISFLESAKAAASQFIGRLQPGDELFLVSSNDTTADIWRRSYHDFSVLQNQIQNLAPAYTMTDLSAALMYSKNLLARAHNINKEIVLFSDLQRSGFKLDSLALEEGQMRLFAVPFREPAIANLSITAVNVRSSILQPGKPLELQVGLSNWGEAPARDKIVQIFVDGKRMAQSAVSVDVGASVQETFHLTLNQSGWIKGYALLEEDDLSQDNRRYFTFYIPDHIQLAIVGDERPGVEFLSLALQPSFESSPYFRITALSPQRLLSQPLDSLNIIVLYDVSLLSDAVIARLRAYQEKGGGLVVVLGRQADIRWYNQVFNPALGLSPLIAAVEEGGTFSLGRTDVEHPIFSGIFEEAESQFAAPRFSFAVKIKPAENAHTIMTFGNGDPYLVESRSRQGFCLLFASSFDPDVSDVAFKTIFAPLMYRALSYVGVQSQNVNVDQATGDLLRYRLPGNLLTAKLTIARPGDELDAVKPALTASGAWLEYRAANVPGVYTLMADGAEISAWAVNIPAAEYNLQPVDHSDLQQKYHMQIVSSPDELTDAVQERRTGREVGRYFLLAALALLLIEMLIYREKREVAPQE